MLTVGVPREVKTEEHRVAITPDGVAEMTHRAVPVLIEHDAGVDSGISDDDYRAAGAEIVVGRGGGVGTRGTRVEGQGAATNRVPLHA